MICVVLYTKSGNFLWIMSTTWHCSTVTDTVITIVSPCLSENYRIPKKKKKTKMPPSSLTLKAKLSALALAQSSPSPPSSHYYNHAHEDSSTTPTSSASTKRKIFQSHAHLAPSWWKNPLRHHVNGWNSNRGEEESNRHVYGDEEKKVVQEVLGKMIFQAGVDFEYVVL